MKAINGKMVTAERIKLKLFLKKNYFDAEKIYMVQVKKLPMYIFFAGLAARHKCHN